MVTKNLTTFSVIGPIYELEQFGSLAVLAHLPVFNIMRNPNPNFHSPKPGTHLGRPPAKYDHPYDGQVVERVMPEDEVRSACMSMGLDILTAACSWRINSTCYVFLPTDGQAPVDTYRRHEIAHCNGWPADHPRDG